MAFKLGHGMRLAFVVAALSAGCESKPKSAGVPANVGAEKAPKQPTSAFSQSTPSTSGQQPVVPVKNAAESPTDRVERVGGKIEREGSTVTRIDFFGTQAEDADLEVLRAFPELQSLGLSGTKVTDAGLTHLLGLKKLRTLSLGFTDITDRGLVTLAKLPELQNVDLLRTKVTSAGIADLQKALPRFEHQQQMTLCSREGSPMGESLVAVSSFWSVPEAHVARNQLEAAGIRAVLQGEEGASAIGIGNLTGGVKVLVRDRDVKRALSVLADTSEELEKALEGDAWEEGSHDEDRRAMEFQTDDDAAEEDTDENDQLVTPGDRSADHAHRVAYLGILVFPILSHLYSTWLLWRLRKNGEELTRAGERAAAKAARLNTIFLTVGGIILAIYVLSLLVR